MKDPFAPLEEGGWNTHQVAAHTRDVDSMVYGMRAKRTAVEDNPEFPSFEADQHNAEHYDADEPLEGMLNGMVESVESLAAMLRGLPGEAWARESRHTTLGSGFTLQTWVERNLAHIEEHTETVKKGT
jgi:Mycothiol maleylpyruvate isomerase N-terminal domain